MQTNMPKMNFVGLRRASAAILSIIIMISTFGACSPGPAHIIKKPPNRSATPIIDNPNDENTISTPTNITDCLSVARTAPAGTGFNACIFHKNPVYQNNGPFSSRLTESTDIRNQQTYAVRISGLDDSGFLQNSTFSIQPVGISRARANDNDDWRHPYVICSTPNTCVADPNHSVAQVMTYYWLNQLRNELLSAGAFYPVDAQVPVKTQNRNPDFQDASYWDDQTREMSLGFSTGLDQALSGEIAAKIMGFANYYYAHPLLQGSSEVQQFCVVPPGPGGSDICCKTSGGCLEGIRRGQANYHAAILFDGGTMGETSVNHLAGTTSCGLSHSPKENKFLTRNEAFNACSGKPGQESAMGLLYVSYWWAVRSRTSSNLKEVDTLFVNHLQNLAANDTFTTVLEKIKALDTTLFNGKYSGAFQQEFLR